MVCDDRNGQVQVNERALIVQDSGDGAGRVALAGTARTKAAALAEVILQPAMLRKIGAAWPLYLRLVLVEEGRMIGDYRGVGQSLGTPPSTAQKWIAALVASGIAEKRNKGRGIEIVLREPHLAIARIPDEVTTVVQSVVEPRTDSVTQGVLKIMEGSRLAGGDMTITVTVANGSART